MTNRNHTIRGIAALVGIALASMPAQAQTNVAPLGIPDNAGYWDVWGNPTDRINNGNIGWNSTEGFHGPNGSGSAKIWVTWPDEYTIDKVKLFHCSAGTQYVAVDYAIQRLNPGGDPGNDGDWTTVLDVTSNSSTVVEHTFSAVTTKGIRLEVTDTDSGGDNTFRFEEMEIYGTLGPDENPPEIDTLDPADDATGVYPGTNLVATFNEPIALTGSGTIAVTEIGTGADGSSDFTIDLTSLPAPNAEVSVGGVVLTIDPASNLEIGREYEVTISSGAIEDQASTPNAYGGTASGEWTFTNAAADGTPPVLAAVDPLDPADEASGVLLDSSLSVTFNENVVVNSGATVVLLDEDFEGNDGLFTNANKATGTDWAHGDPESANEGGGAVTEGNNRSAQCWGTNLTGPYAADTDACLRSPVINLSGIAAASLSFAKAIDAEAGNTLEVNVIDATTDTVITNLIPATEDGDINTSPWETVGPVALSSAALGQSVRIEWRFTGDPSAAYLGAYLDDVMVTGVGTADVITLKDLTNMTDTVIAVSDSSQVSVSGSTLTINPAATLAAESNYAVQIGSMAIRNYNDLNFAGIADTTTWNFATTGPMTLTWDPGGGGTSDGAGTWLDPGKWWNGAANVDWGNPTPDNAVIGNGGAGGNITLGAVNAGTVLLDNFSGTYTFSGGSLDQSGGITIGTTAGNVTINSAVSGTGGITINGPSRVNLRLGGANTFSGDLIVGGGGEALDDNFDGIGTGNLNLNGGAYVNYWGDTLSRTLGTGAGQMQVPGGESGFSGQGRNGFNVRFNNNTGFEVVWGASGEGAATGLFNPSTLLLQTPWANTNGKINFQNPVDLNGATRTVKVNKNDNTGGGILDDGWAIMSGAIRNSDTGNTAGLVKEGPGRLIFTATNTYDGGTTVNEGEVQYDRADAMPSAGNHAFNDGTELWVRVGGGSQFTGAASGAGSLGGLLTGTGTGGSTVSFSGDVALTLRPSGSPDYAGPLSMTGGNMTDLWIFDGSMTLSGTGSYSGETLIGRRGGTAITVTLGSSTALPSGTPVTVDTSGSSQLDLNGNDATIGLLKLGSNNGGARGQVTDTAGTGTLTLTNGVFCDDHNNGNGGISAGFLDLNGATQVFQVRDGTQASDLLVTSVVQNGSLTMTGLETNATMELSGACTYTGGTQVTNGILIVSGSLADASMTISGGTVQGRSGTLTCNIDGTTTDQITMTGGTLDASALTVNVKATGSGLTLAEYVLVDATGGGTISGTFAGLTGTTSYALDYGTANQVKLVRSAGNPYGTWAADAGGNFLGTLTDTDPLVDFDGGGLKTGIEWVVGGDPTDPRDDASLAPTGTTDGSYLVFTYQRADAAAADANTVIKVEYATDARTWNDAVDGTDGVVITVTDGSPNDTVEVKIPLSLAGAGGKLFARLNVTITPRTDPDPLVDFDGGGLKNGIEWVVGGDPTDPRDDASLAPTGTTDGTYLVFTYRRTDAAAADANTVIKAEYATDARTWNDAVDGTDGVVIAVTDGSPNDTVEVKIPLSLAGASGKLFARLNVTITP